MIILVIVMSSCGLTSWKEVESVGVLRDSIHAAYAPDKRVAVFNVDMSFDNGVVSFSGDSDQGEAVDLLIRRTADLGFKVNNKVNVLPDTSIGLTPFAVVNNSVANIRSQGRHSAELATQALLGMELKVLQIVGEWYLVQTPDQYIGWVDHGGVQLMTEEEITAWRGKQKLLVTGLSGLVMDLEGNQVISDVVMGGVLALEEELENGYKVIYPDGRTGILSLASGEPLDQWKASLVPSGELVASYAKRLIGLPYLWGGTSAKGVDCSGLTKTAYLMNGITLARDASQQVNDGLLIDEAREFEKLKTGDLLFFGSPETDSTARKVRHVAIWLGNNEFIHSSQRVKIGSFDPESPIYDDYNLNRYLCTRRYLPD